MKADIEKSEAVTIFDVYLGGSPKSTVEDKGLVPELQQSPVRCRYRDLATGRSLIQGVLACVCK